MPTPDKVESKSVAEIRKRFSDVLKAVADFAKDSSDALCNARYAAAFRPDKNEWTGDLFDYDNRGKPFDRTENDADMLNAIKDATSPGVVGDLQLTILQGDYLSAMERAQRLRETTRCRAQIHTACRKRGHGHASGLFNKGIMGLLKRLSVFSKGNQS